MMTTTTNIDQLIDRFQEVYQGNPWYGDSFQRMLHDVTPEMAQAQPPSHHSIAQLVWHMVKWRMPLLERLNGNLDFRASSDDPDNFPRYRPRTAEDWREALDTFARQQEEILSLLRQKSDSYLEEEYRDGHDMAWFINGVLQHDVYHIGQIGVVKTMVRGV